MPESKSKDGEGRKNETKPNSMPKLPPRPAAMPKLPKRKKPQAESQNADSTPVQNASSSFVTRERTKVANGSSSSQQNSEQRTSHGTSSSTSLSTEASSIRTSVVREPAREDPQTAKLRKGVHQLRVLMMRAAYRLGWQDHFVHQVMYRLQLAENLQLPKLRHAAPLHEVAQQEATMLEGQQGPDTPLGMRMTVLLIGFRSTGKTSLVNTLLGRDASPPASPAPTNGITIERGLVAGIEVVCIDTPGLDPCPSATFQNMKAVRQIAAAHRKFRPDTVLYVDHLQGGRNPEDEASVLLLLSSALGVELWCSTVVAFTHAGSVPTPWSRTGGASSSGSTNSSSSQPSWRTVTEQREHALQIVIRQVSGDPRLVNPKVWVESQWGGGACALSEGGEPLVFEGHPFRLHLRLMLLSAKILADCEALFGLQDTGKGLPPSGPPPMGYLLGQVLNLTDPVRFPSHPTVQEMWRRRKAIQDASDPATDPWQRKALVREAGDMERQLRTQQRYQSVIMTSGVDRVLHPQGGQSKLDPPRPYRHVAVLGSDSRGMICTKTVARPQVEASSSYDHGDSVAGVALEHSDVLFPGAFIAPGLPTSGLPYSLSTRGQCGKDRILVQARGEMSAYHDLMERHISSLVVEVQTSGNVEALEALYTVQADHHMQVLQPGRCTVTAGAIVAELAPGGNMLRGCPAVGGRLQSRLRGQLGRLMPAAVGLCLGHMIALCPGGEREHSLGVNAEMNTQLLSGHGGGEKAQASVSSSLMRVKGGWNRSVQGSVQWKAGGAKWGATVQAAGGKGRLRLRLHSQRHHLVGLLGLLPILSSAVRYLNRQRAEGQKIAEG